MLNKKNRKSKDNIKTSFLQDIKLMLSYCKNKKLIISISIACAVLSTVFTIIAPHQLQQIVNMIQTSLGGNIDLVSIRNLCLFLAAVYLSIFIFSYLQRKLIANVTQSLSYNLREAIIKKINSLPMYHFNEKENGDILSFITNDIDLIGQALNQSVSTFISSVLLFIGSIIMMFLNNVTLAVTAITATLLGFVLMLMIVKLSQKYFNRQQELIGELNGIIEETYTNTLIITLNNAENKFNSLFNHTNQRIFSVAWKAQYLSGMMMPLMGFIGNLGYVSVCIAGGIMVLNGDILIGTIVAFMLYIKIFTEPLSQISQAVANFQQAVAACKRVNKFLAKQEMKIERDIELGTIKGRIEFDHVIFGYHENKSVIDDISMVIEPEQKVAIVGQTGSGKTTIVNLLLRFYELNSGSIKIDHISTKDMSRTQLHSLFSLVMQDTWLYDGTVMENIIYGRSEITENSVLKTCKNLGIHHFIQSLPNGYDTLIDDDTILSAGQKQLITIARAVVVSAPILILDEATSYVDTRLEMLVQKALNDIMQDKTSIVLAHRLSTIKSADMILVIKDGKIVEKGTHEELLRGNTHYSELYNSQFKEV